MLASQNEFGSDPSFAISWKSLKRIDVHSPLKFSQNFSVNPSGPGIFFVETLFLLF
jgi:hypothetical protein